jgi:nucleoside-diphosphate-sugar epimerase
MNEMITDNRSVLVTGGSGFIGTNLVSRLVADGYHVTNLDQASPNKPEHQRYWKQVGILDAGSLDAAITAAQPAIVIHLAGRADTRGKCLEDYAENTVGVANLLAALKKVATVQRFVAASAQFVVAPGSLPAHDLDFRPHTVYGESKVIGEKLVRDAKLACIWTIVRPTMAWGPWHPRYPREFWRVLKWGLYIHPGRSPVIRNYGYVENIVDQIVKIITAPSEIVNRRVFYLGDEAVNVLDWANAFSRALTGREVRIVPRALFRGVALAGDLANRFGVPIPINSSRFRSMTEDYLAPIAPTFEALGRPKFTLSEGVSRTVQWLRQQDPFWELR